MTYKTDLLNAASNLTTWSTATYPDTGLVRIDPADHRDGFDAVADIATMIANYWMPLDSANATIIALQAAIDAKFPIPAGTTAQYLRGDGSTATFPAIPSTTRTTTPQTLSIVGTGATGTQISSTKDSTVRFSVQASSTVAAILGGATSVSSITLKKCATNDPTEANWTTVGEVESNQTLTGALTLSSIQLIKGMLETDLSAS